MDLKVYLDEFDAHSSRTLDITGLSTDITTDVTPGAYDLILWSDCPGDTLSYVDLKRKLLHLQQAANCVIITCPDQKTIASHPRLALTYDWLSNNLSLWSFFSEQKEDQPGERTIIGAWLGPTLGAPLMIAPQTPDTDALGLVPGENYLASDMQHFWEQVEWVTTRPHESQQIAANGHVWYLKFKHWWHENILPRQIDLMLKS